MKIETSLKKLKEIIPLIERIAGKQPTLPVLSCILIENTKNTTVFRATNLDVGIEIPLATKSEGTGTIAVPAHTLAAFISQINDQNQQVRLELVSNNLVITSAKSKGTIKTLPPEDFPAIPKVSDGQQFSVSAELFVKGLRSVWYSAAVSGIKPELSSIYIYEDKGYIVFVATDSFRLAEKKIKATVSQMHDMLIPLKNIPDIIRTLEGVPGDVKIRSNKNLVSFEAGDAYLASRIIDGVFPDYRQIIPKSFGTEAVVLKQDLINALKVSNVFSDKFNQIHIALDPKNKSFEIQTKNSDVGENKTAVDAALSGDKMEINFNYKYVSDCFQSIESDSLSLQLSGANRPMVIRPVSGDQTFMYLVMPMNR